MEQEERREEEEEEDEPSPPAPHSPQDSGRDQDTSPPPNGMMPSPSSNDDFIVDGFDFSTGVSICHVLASDSGDEEEEVMAPVKGPQQLSSALMKVLGVSKPQHPQHGEQCLHADLSLSDGRVPLSADMLVGGMASNPVRAMTLEEIEEHSSPRAASKHSPQQQFAFDKFLAQIQSSSSHEERRPPDMMHHSSEVSLQAPSMRLPHPPLTAAGPPVRASPAMMAGVLEDHSARVAALNTPFQ